MRLGTRDVFATLFVTVGVLAALSVTAGWGWPLMNGVRVGIIVLGLAGILACSVSGWSDEVATHRTSWANPFIILASLVGGIALVVGVIGLFANTMIYLEAMIIAVIAVWLVTVVHRLFAGVATRPITAA